jgi:hypothetical protein
VAVAVAVKDAQGCDYDCGVIDHVPLCAMVVNDCDHDAIGHWPLCAMVVIDDDETMEIDDVEVMVNDRTRHEANACSSSSRTVHDTTLACVTDLEDDRSDTG